MFSLLSIRRASLLANFIAAAVPVVNIIVLMLPIILLGTTSSFVFSAGSRVSSNFDASAPSFGLLPLAPEAILVLLGSFLIIISYAPVSLATFVIYSARIATSVELRVSPNGDWAPTHWLRTAAAYSTRFIMTNADSYTFWDKRVTDPVLFRKNLKLLFSNTYVKRSYSTSLPRTSARMAQNKDHCLHIGDDLPHMNALEHGRTMFAGPGDADYNSLDPFHGGKVLDLKSTDPIHKIFINPWELFKRHSLIFPFSSSYAYIQTAPGANNAVITLSPTPLEWTQHYDYTAAICRLAMPLFRFESTMWTVSAFHFPTPTGAVADCDIIYRLAFIFLAVPLNNQTYPSNLNIAFGARVYRRDEHLNPRDDDVREQTSILASLAKLWKTLARALWSRVPFYASLVLAPVFPLSVFLTINHLDLRNSLAVQDMKATIDFFELVSTICPILSYVLSGAILTASLGNFFTPRNATSASSWLLYIFSRALSVAASDSILSAFSTAFVSSCIPASRGAAHDDGLQPPPVTANWALTSALGVVILSAVLFALSCAWVFVALVALLLAHAFTRLEDWLDPPVLDRAPLDPATPLPSWWGSIFRRLASLLLTPLAPSGRVFFGRDLPFPDLLRYQRALFSSTPRTVSYARYGTTTAASLADAPRVGDRGPAADSCTNGRVAHWLSALMTEKHAAGGQYSLTINFFGLMCCLLGFLPFPSDFVKLTNTSRDVEIPHRSLRWSKSTHWVISLVRYACPLFRAHESQWAQEGWYFETGTAGSKAVVDCTVLYLLLLRHQVVPLNLVKTNSPILCSWGGKLVVRGAAAAGVVDDDDEGGGGDGDDNDAANREAIPASSVWAVTSTIFLSFVCVASFASFGHAVAVSLAVDLVFAAFGLPTILSPHFGSTARSLAAIAGLVLSSLGVSPLFASVATLAVLLLALAPEMRKLLPASSAAPVQGAAAAATLVPGAAAAAAATVQGAAVAGGKQKGPKPFVLAAIAEAYKLPANVSTHTLTGEDLSKYLATTSRPVLDRINSVPQSQRVSIHSDGVAITNDAVLPAIITVLIVPSAFFVCWPISLAVSRILPIGLPPFVLATADSFHYYFVAFIAPSLNSVSGSPLLSTAPCVLLRASVFVIAARMGAAEGGRKMSPWAGTLALALFVASCVASVYGDGAIAQTANT
jgi:hypothetical protein